MGNSFKMTHVQNHNKIHPPEEKSHKVSERGKIKSRISAPPFFLL